MPQTYAFQISMPVTDTLPRNRISNTIHMQHVIGSLADTDLQSMTADIVAMYQARYGDATKEIMCKAYDTDAKPNYPRATSVVHAGVPWTSDSPREVALVLSFSGNNRGNKSERGRIYLMPGIGTAPSPGVLRPTLAAMDWALAFYSTSNASFPDLGGIDWQFDVWSKPYQKFTPWTQAWVNDDWDTKRRRGLRE